MWSNLTGDASEPVVSTAEVAELKAWARRAWWAGYTTPRQKARAVAEIATIPWRSARAIVRVVGAHAPLVSRTFGVPLPLQLAQVVAARLRYGLDPIAYYRFRLFEAAQWRRAGRFVQTADTALVLRWLVSRTPGYPRVFGDKRAFEAWCARHGLSCVATLAEFEGGRMTRPSAPGAWLPSSDLFSKPSNWQGGQGVERWTYRDGRYVGRDGAGRDAAALVGELSRLSATIGRPILLQRLLRNAPSEAGLSTGGLCTVRLATIRHPGRGPEVLYAVYRMPTGEAAADNFYLGGLGAPIDLATGRLGRAVRKDLRKMPAPAARHPDTGAAIEGHELPHWAAALGLARRAHAAIDWNGVPVVGWDIALLEEGPVLLEGNNLPCSTFAQMASGVPLGNTAFVACVNAHLRERFANSR